MFFTRMPINAARRGAKAMLASPQVLHAAVLAGFADAQPSEEGRVLWRLDRHTPPARTLLYVVSPDKPDFTHIVEQAGWPTTESWDTRSYDELLMSLKRGERWQFRLTANPVRSGRRSEWSETKPLGHVTVDQQQQWLVDRTERLGFGITTTGSGPEGESDNHVHDLTVVDRAVRKFERRGTRVTLATATFQGGLVVTDPEALRRSLTHGIGRGKAYGCGLLTLARPLRGQS